MSTNHAKRLAVVSTVNKKFKPKVTIANAVREISSHSDEDIFNDRNCYGSEPDNCHLTEEYAELEARFEELQRTSFRIAHDLRAPLRVITGFSNCILEEANAALGEQSISYVNRICAASKRMEIMLEGILKLASIDLLDVRKESLDLSRLVTQYAKESEIRDRRRHVEFKMEKDIAVLGDTGLLTSLICNLLENAWKYTSKEASTVIEFGCKRQNEEIFYFVRDNGVGFDQNKEGQLFKAFVRLRGHDEFPGIGLGLATARRIVELHGGTIRAEGEVGKGATIWFSLPGEKED